MGFKRLTLIAPRQDKPFQNPEAIALASGAQDVLEQALEMPTLGPALSNCSLVLGLTSRERQFGPPELSWQEACQRATQLLMNEEQVAVVFGPERTGLDNEALKLCSHRVYLDANPAYPSLNLAQAVMVCAYTLRQSLQAKIALQQTNARPKAPNSELADPIAVAAMAEHWRQGLESIGYLDPDRPKKLMPRLEALFARAELHKEEIDLLRGIAKQMLTKK
jgi:tRNA/rRNA methyltransferase